jgi:hypothetical protein
LQEKILEEILGFAKGKSIDAVYKGYDPEDKEQETYYFLIKGLKISDNIHDEVIDFEMELLHNKNIDISLVCLPYFENLKECPFPFVKEKIYKV